MTSMSDVTCLHCRPSHSQAPRIFSHEATLNAVVAHTIVEAVNTYINIENVDRGR